MVTKSPTLKPKLMFTGCVNGNAHPTIFRSFHIRLDHRRSWRQNQNDSPYLFAIVHRPLAAIADCSAARQQMDQNEDMKRLLQQLLLLPPSACCRSADECLPQMYIDS